MTSQLHLSSIRDVGALIFPRRSFFQSMFLRVAFCLSRHLSLPLNTSFMPCFSVSSLQTLCSNYAAVFHIFLSRLCDATAVFVFSPQIFLTWANFSFLFDARDLCSVLCGKIRAGCAEICRIWRQVIAMSPTRQSRTELIPQFVKFNFGLM